MYHREFYSGTWRTRRRKPIGMSDDSPPRRGKTRTLKEKVSSITRQDQYEKYLVQEVTMAYSTALSASGGLLAPASEDLKRLATPLKVHVSHEPYRYRRRYSSGSLRDYIQDYDSRVRSTDRVSRRQETEFPVRVDYNVPPYRREGTFPQSYAIPVAVSSSPLSDGFRVYPPRDSRARAASSLGSLLTETTTEEYRSFSTSRKSMDDMAGSPPSVHALRQQFEQGAHREWSESQQTRRPRISPTGTNIVVVTRPSSGMAEDPGVYRMIPSPDSRVRRIERPAYTPEDQRTVLSTTVVDIEPPTQRSLVDIDPQRSRVTSPEGRRYMEETFREEFRTFKTYVNPPKKNGSSPPAIKIPVHVQPTQDVVTRTTQGEGGRKIISETIREDIYVRSSSRGTSPAPQTSPPPGGQVLRTITTFDGRGHRAPSPPRVSTQTEEVVIRRRAFSPDPQTSLADDKPRYTLTQLEEWRRNMEMERERMQAAAKVSEWHTEEDMASPPITSPHPPVVEEPREHDYATSTTTITQDVRTVTHHIAKPKFPAPPPPIGRGVEIVGREVEIAPSDELRRKEEEERTARSMIEIEERRMRLERESEERRRAEEERRRKKQMEIVEIEERRMRMEREIEERKRVEEESRRKEQMEMVEIEERRIKMERENEDRKRAEEERRRKEQQQMIEIEERRMRMETERREQEERRRKLEDERRQKEKDDEEGRRRKSEERREEERLERERQDAKMKEEKERRAREMREERERREKEEAQVRERREKERIEREIQERIVIEERSRIEEDVRTTRLEREQRDSEERQRRIEKERREREELERKSEQERIEADERRIRMEKELAERQEELRRREEERREADRIRVETEKRTIEERMRRLEEERIEREEKQKAADDARRKEREDRERREREERETRIEEERRRKEKDEQKRQIEKEEREKRDTEERERREREIRERTEGRIRTTVEEEITSTWNRRAQPAIGTLTREPDLDSPTRTNTTGRTATTTTTEFTIGKGAAPAPMDLPEYRSTITSRPGFNRTGMSGTYSTSSTTSYGSPLSGARTLKIVNEMGSSTISGMSPFGQHAASSIRDSREREKKEMSDLNDRLANYIEKVRFLEAQNRKIGNDLEMLRGKWGKDTSNVRVMYESELREARTLIEDTNKQRDELEKQIRRLIDELADYRKKYENALHQRELDRVTIDDLLDKLGKLEAEISTLKRKIAHLEEDVTRIKKENHRMIGELQRARNDLDQETLNRIDHQNQVQTLLEEIDFIKRVQDQEIKELQSMVSRDTTPENREYFKNELASAIRDIRQEYDQRMNSNRTDIESWYRLKVQEIQTASSRQNMEHGYAKEEIRRLRTQLGDLRGKLADLEGRNALLEKQTQELNYQLEDDQRSYEAALNDRDAQIRKMREECQALMVELQMLLDTKQTLDAEIAIYRKMLEGEENRAGLRQLVEQVVKTKGISQSDELESMRTIKGETSTRTSFQRSAKGNVSIHETSPDGKFVVVENTHRSKDEPIGDWKLKRKIDGKHEIVFTFPAEFVLRPGKSVKIFAHGHGVYSPPDTLVLEHDDSWGIGHNVQTILFNAAGEERATHIQRSSHS